MSENIPGGVRRARKVDTVKLVYLAILTALVAVLQIVSNVTAGVLAVPITLTLVPIVMGCALCGRFSGAWLGLVFGVVVLISGAAEPFFAWSPLATVAIVIVKGVLAGLAAGLIYSFVEKFNKYVAIIAAGATAPIVNTGIFLLGAFLFFSEDISTNFVGGGEIFTFVITVLVGVNFLIELGVNMLLAPIILRLVNIKKKN